MREVAGSTPGLDFYLLCEPICVSLRLYTGLSVNVHCFDCEVNIGIENNRLPVWF
jgi:hypothetical protein